MTEKNYTEQNFILHARQRVRRGPHYKIKYWGKVVSFDGILVQSSNFPCSVGSICKIINNDGQEITGEIVKISEQNISIIPFENHFPISVGQVVELVRPLQAIGVGSELLGRAIDGLGLPLDGGNTLDYSEEVSLEGNNLNPLQRRPVQEIFDVGIRSINTLLTLGKGQRIGIIAGSGVGKSVLLSMVAKNSSADVVVIALIGERGREVASFTKEILQSHSKDKVLIVAVPANHSPLLRIQGAKRATAVAEYFRDSGKNVLLIMDSLTRVAHAQRELGLALGEQPTARGYPPSVLSLLPKLIERTGTSSQANGAITSIYTVLADGDDVTSDPIVDTARAILDGHIVLDRNLAQQGIYPAIDVNKSISRLMTSLVRENQIQKAKTLKMLIAKYFENRDLVLMGGYAKGQDAELDMAMSGWALIQKFLVQGQNEVYNYNQSAAALDELMSAL